MQKLFRTFLKAGGGLGLSILLSVGLAQGDYLSKDIAAKLSINKELFVYKTSATALELLPEHSLAAFIAKPLKAWTTVEVLTSIPLEQKLTQLELYNHLRSISSMQGLSYFSTSRGLERELFKKTYVISAKDKQPLAFDPLLTKVLAQDELLVVLDDTTFGENTYLATYQASQTDDAILLNIRNLSTLRYHLMPVFTKNELVITLLIIPQPKQQSLLLYGLLSAKVPPVPLFRDIFQESLKQRLFALKAWFIKGL